MGEVYSSGSWKAKDGEEEQFVAAWSEFARWLNTMPGAGTARLTEDLSEPGRYLSFADWESEEAMQAWKSDPAFREHMGPVQAHVAEFTPSEWRTVAQV
jgi:heme-degrading monooxygenase HmoA